MGRPRSPRRKSCALCIAGSTAGPHRSPHRGTIQARAIHWTLQSARAARAAARSPFAAVIEDFAPAPGIPLERSPQSNQRFVVLSWNVEYPALLNLVRERCLGGTLQK